MNAKTQAASTTQTANNAPRDTPVFQKIATLLTAAHNCEISIDSGHNREHWTEMRERHMEEINDLVDEHLPSGSGFDCGTRILIESWTRGKSIPRLVFETEFHHMNEDGFYTGWTHHTIRVYPDLLFGFRLTISGPNDNNIKDYIGDCFDYALNKMVS